MILKLLKKHAARRRRGAIALLTAIAMIPTTAMLSASINTAQMTDDKRRAQDAADALASMHQTWAARSLNVISMNNVSATQITALAIGAEALDHTLEELEYRATGALAWILFHGVLHCTDFNLAWATPCFLNHGWGAREAYNSRGWARSVRSAYQTKETVELAHASLRAVDQMNEAIVARFPTAMREIAQDYADVYRIDSFYFIAPCEGEGKNCQKGRTQDGMSLPVERKNAMTTAERCHAMHYSSSMLGKSIGGLPNVLAPLGVSGRGMHRRSFDARGFTPGVGPIYGGANNTHLRDHIQNVIGSGTGRRIDQEFSKFQNYYKRPRFMARKGLDKLPDAINVQRIQRHSDNSFTRRFNWKLTSACLPLNHDDVQSMGSIAGAAQWLVDIIGGSKAALLVDKYRMLFEGERPEAWWPIGRTWANTPLRTRITDMEDAYKVLVFTAIDTGPATKTPAYALGWDPTGDRVGTKILGNRVTQHYGYAQSGLFNPDGGDFYTQNWRFRLMPAERLDSPGPVADALKSRAPAGYFENLATSLAGVKSTASWRHVNTH